MVDGKILIIVLYFHDLILTGDEKIIKYCKDDIAREFEMKDMEVLNYFLGLEIWKRDGELFVSQGNNSKDILRKFQYMKGNKPMETSLVGN